MDMVAGTLGLPAPPLRLLGTRPLVAPGRTLVLGPGPLAATVAKEKSRPLVPHPNQAHAVTGRAGSPLGEKGRAREGGVIGFGLRDLYPLLCSDGTSAT